MEKSIAHLRVTLTEITLVFGDTNGAIWTLTSGTIWCQQTQTMAGPRSTTVGN